MWRAKVTGRIMGPSQTERAIYAQGGCPQCSLGVQRYQSSFTLSLGANVVAGLNQSSFEANGRAIWRTCPQRHIYFEGIEWMKVNIRCWNCQRPFMFANPNLTCTSCGNMMDLGTLCMSSEAIVRQVLAAIGLVNLHSESFKFMDFNAERANLASALVNSSISQKAKTQAVDEGVMTPSTRPPAQQQAEAASCAAFPPMKETYHIPYVLHGRMRYEVLGLVGEGGFAKVHLARDAKNQFWAVKQAWGYRTDDMRQKGKRINPFNMAVEKLRIEAGYLREASRLLEEWWKEQASKPAEYLRPAGKPGIVRYIEHFEQDAELYMITEFVDGPNLKEYVRSRRQSPDSGLNVHEALRLFKQWLDVVKFIHSRTNKVHRDFTPSNILMRGSDPVLIDFGTIADDTGPSAGGQTGIQAGGYHAPEEAQGVSSKLCDIYSLGSCLYFLLTGKDPAEALPNSPSDKIMRHEMTRAGIPFALQEIVMRARAFSPGHRYQDAERIQNAVYLFEHPELKQCTTCGSLMKRLQMACRECGTRYCTGCGFPVTGQGKCDACGRRICAWCGIAMRAEAEYCRACGASTKTRVCHICKGAIPEKSEYCRLCGASAV